MTSAAASGARLRLARQARGYSQQQLAGMADVSRQAVSAIEANQSDPSLRVALALAQALGMTVDELFGSVEGVAPLVRATVIGPPALWWARGPARVTLAPVGDSLVGLPLAGAAVSRAGFRPAGGLLAGDGAGDAPGEPAAVPGRTTWVRPIGPPRPTLVIAGCDPALPLLAEPLSLLDPPIAFAWWPCSSQEALRLAAGGLVHVAGVHLRDRSGESNVGSAAELLAGSEVIGFSSWREGLVLERGNVAGVSGIGDVVSRGLRLVNREPGAEARRVLDRELAAIGVDGRQLPGYQTRAAGHLQVAEAVAAGLADAGVACEPAALAYGLGFVPLAAECFDLVIPARHAATREVQALLRVLRSRWISDQLASLPGYDAGSCGQQVST